LGHICKTCADEEVDDARGKKGAGEQGSLL
jgi:hypothetical protein